MLYLCKILRTLNIYLQNSKAALMVMRRRFMEENNKIGEKNFISLNCK